MGFGFKRYFRLYDFFIIIGCFAMFFPSFHVYLESAGAILINGLVIVFSFIAIALNYRKNVKNQLKVLETKSFKLISGIFIVLLIHIPISMSLGSLFSDFTIVTRDFYELHRPILYLLIFCLAYFSITSYEDLEKLNKIMIFIFVCFIIFGINQNIRFSDDLTVLYTKFHNARTRRLSIPFVNPYDYAFVMILFIFYYLFRFVYNHWAYLFFFIIALVLFMLTQSRSMAVGLLFGLIIVVPIFMIYNQRMPLFKGRLSFGMMKYGILSIAGIIGFSILLSYILTNFSYLTKSFVRIIESGSLESMDNATSIRKDQLMFTLDLAVSNPFILLFGNGAAKEKMEFVESMYTYFLFRYGLIGLVVYFLIPLLLGIKYTIICLKLLTTKDALFPFFAAILVWLICLPLCSIGNNITEQVRVSFLYYSILAILIKGSVVLRKRKIINLI
ncbi:hypothetical protein ACFSKL_18475 [Belliella marina]|uniref:Uncharacterized protein n=1 Tax=Belliella marina TaxID=1644146 RepID=A0ABW4VPT0_9BACT